MVNAEKPMENKDQVNIGTDEPDSPYRELADTKSACPPATKLHVEHHIDTGDDAPIMLKRRRQAQTEDGVVEGNVDSMLKAGVIEHGEGAWGFPVVLVRKKAGTSIESLVRTYITYHAVTRLWKLSVGHVYLAHWIYDLDTTKYESPRLTMTKLHSRLREGYIV
ncbi:hypothetical protein PHMEG_00039660 [Phytophthora megakarya]|uniref:Reverse transcriptase n=1 Tax=Phytophthora megakarya TaxID=4795 RepID=A0A225UEM0_9STRA|nr:hypothetical protein PHMEG_00039660 [Phytophthora megakarya]